MSNSDRARGREYYEKVLGKPPPKSLEGLREQTVDHLFADVWSRDNLSIRDRRLITIGLLASQGRKDQLKSHIRGALVPGGEGLSQDEILEVFVQVAHYAGWAAGMSGTLAAEEVLAEKTSQRDKDKLST